MALVLLPPTQKPPVWAKPTVGPRGQPGGLIYLASFNEGVGAAHNAANPADPPLVLAGGAAWTTTIAGGAISTGTSSGYASSAMPAAVAAVLQTQVYSVLMGVQNTGTAQANTFALNIHGTTGNGILYGFVANTYESFISAGAGGGRQTIKNIGSDTTLHYIGLVVDATNSKLRLYWDGAEVYNGTYTGANTVGDFLYVGSGNTSSGFFLGKIPYLGIYKRALSASEMQAQTAAQFAMVQTRAARPWTIAGGSTTPSATDAATVTETATIAAATAASQAVTVTDTGLIGTPASGTDTGTVTDTATIAAAVTAAEAATVTEVAAIIPGAINDPAMVWTPYNWRLSGTTYRETDTQNACVEFEFQSDSLAVDIDTTPYAAVGTADWPGLQWTVDHGAWTSIARPNSGTSLGANKYRMTIATGLSTGGAWHHVKVQASFTNGADTWSVVLLRILRFVRSTGAVIDASRPPTFLWTKNFLLFGDSTMTDVDGLGAATEDSWGYAVGRAFGANVGLSAYAGTGWRRSATPTNTPQFHNPADTTNQSWRWYSNGQSRLVGGLILPAPDYVLVNLGTNDFNISIAAATLQAAVTDWLTLIRAAVGPLAHIFVMVPFGQSYQSNLAASVVGSGDARVHLIDLGTEMALGLGPSFGGATWRATDNIHPTMLAQAEIAARTVGAIRDALTGTPRPLEVI